MCVCVSVLGASGDRGVARPALHPIAVGVSICVRRVHVCSRAR